MSLVAIDPGTVESAVVVWDGKTILHAEILPNSKVLIEFCRNRGGPFNDHLAIEMVACYGMPVGKEVFETVLWIGKFVEAWDSRVAQNFTFPAQLIYRRDIKHHHCGNMHAKDANVAQALRDKYGDKGTKRSPGVTYGLKSHLWQAFALATYVSETTIQPKENNEAKSPTTS